MGKASVEDKARLGVLPSFGVLLLFGSLEKDRTKKEMSSDGGVDDGGVHDMILDDGGDGGWDIFGTDSLDVARSRSSGFWRSLSKEYVKRQISIRVESAFQKEISYNRLLPYYNVLAREADEQLSAIKAGLGLSVLLREVQPALLHWASELDK